MAMDKFRELKLGMTS